MKIAETAGHRALTKIEVVALVAALTLLAAWFLSAHARAKAKAQRICCVSNLKHIGLSFRIWSGDHTNLCPMSLSTEFGGTREHIETGEVFRHFQVLSNELSTPILLHCPADRSRRRASDFKTPLGNANISYFVGLDADETRPNMLLAGDSNLEVDGKPVGPGLLNLWTNSAVGWTAERHNRCGNVALADGSVQQFSNAKLRGALVNTGVATNRLAIP